MAKRKKLKNVKINEQELTPTVIGYLNEKKASSLFLIVVFGILLAFLYYLPEINKYVEQKRGNDYSNNVPYVPNDNEGKFEQNDAGKEFEFSEEAIIVMNEITFSEFNIVNDTLSFVAKNNSNKMIDIGQYEYYIYLKDSEGNINDVIKIDDIVVLEESEKDLTFNVESISINKMFIDVFKEEYINEIDLIADTLTCTLEDETYTYNFENDILKNEKYIYENFDASDSLIYKYQKRKEKYEIYEGIEIDFDDNNGLYYEVTIDLNIADTTKLNDENIFDKTYKPKVIKFKMEENGYFCS